jgi:SAM-dependent methyltransferase
MAPFRFLDLGETPLADAFAATPDAPQPCYPLRLRVDPSTWMVELEDQVPDEALFGADYGFFSGSSPALVHYFADYARWCRQRFPEQVARGVVEIACNDGTLLAHFADGTHLGIDPAGPPTVEARSKGLNVHTAPFTAELAAKLEPGGLVIANNVTAHVPDLDDFLAGIAHLVADGGVAVLEFQYFPDLLLGNGFDLVYHEHRRFLSLSSLVPAVERHGLAVRDVARTPTQGGSIRVTVGKPGEAATNARVSMMLDDEAWIRDLAPYQAFQGQVDAVRRNLWDLIIEERRTGRKVALYGAPAKATTLLNYCGLRDDVIDYSVDLTPSKVGRYVPGTGIPIIHPADESAWRKADTYILAIGNYLGSVLRREREFLESGGRFILPLPKPVVI